MHLDRGNLGGKIEVSTDSDEEIVSCWYQRPRRLVTMGDIGFGFLLDNPGSVGLFPEGQVRTYVDRGDLQLVDVPSTSLGLHVVYRFELGKLSQTTAENTLLSAERLPGPHADFEQFLRAAVIELGRSFDKY